MKEKSKICIYVKYHGSFYDKYLLNLVNSIKHREVFIASSKKIDLKFNINVNFLLFENIDYWNNNNDYKELSWIIDKLHELKIYRLHILRFNFENLFSVLYNNNLVKDFNISFGIFGHREILETKTRKNLIKNIANLEFVKNIVVHSISKDVYSPEFDFDNNKFHFVSDPIYDKVSDYIFGESKNTKLRFTYFGSFFYGKGVDILIDSILKLDSLVSNQISFTLAGNISKSNFEVNIPESDNIEIINKYLSEEDVIKLFKKSDVIILPYRKTYENDTSGVLVQASLAKRLTICPDFFPFNHVTKKYNLGVLFEAESSINLADSIEYVAKNYSILKTKAQHKNFIENISTWDDICKNLDL